MNRNLSNEELINRYLDNEMDKIEQLDFENRLVKDPVLQEEYGFQKDLIEGIKEVRRLELKSRFANIPITTPFLQTLVGKAVVIVSASSIIGVGSYYLLKEKNDIGLSQVEIKKENPIIVQKNVIPDIPEVTFKSTPPKEEIKKPVQKQQIQSQPEASTKKIEKKTNIVRPEVVKPDLAENLKEEEVNTENINPKNLNNIDQIQNNIENKVAVETIEDRRNNFHYKFFDNKLYLLGDFKDMPYEIIELNEKAGKKYFLFYNGSYYRLMSDRVKPTPLVKVENDSIIQELKIIQENK